MNHHRERRESWPRRRRMEIFENEVRNGEEICAAGRMAGVSTSTAYRWWKASGGPPPRVLSEARTGLGRIEAGWRVAKSADQMIFMPPVGLESDRCVISAEAASAMERLGWINGLVEIERLGAVTIYAVRDAA